MDFAAPADHRLKIKIKRLKDQQIPWSWQRAEKL